MLNADDSKRHSAQGIELALGIAQLAAVRQGYARYQTASGDRSSVSQLQPLGMA